MLIASLFLLSERLKRVCDNGANTLVDIIAIFINKRLVSSHRHLVQLLTTFSTRKSVSRVSELISTLPHFAIESICLLSARVLRNKEKEQKWRTEIVPSSREKYAPRLVKKTSRPSSFTARIRCMGSSPSRGLRSSSARSFVLRKACHTCFHFHLRD